MEQARLLHKVPTVIPDVEEVGPVYEDVEDDEKDNEGSPKSILIGTSEILCDNWKGNGTSSDVAVINGKSSAENIIFGSSNDGDGNGQAIHADIAAKVTEEKREHQEHVYIPEERTLMSEAPAKEEKKQVLIDLSGDDDSDDKSSIALGKQKLEDPESSIWYRLGPDGERGGPFSLSVLKTWSQRNPFALNFKVWKTSQIEEQAILLTDAVDLAFPRI